jgi:predicted nucleotidyltransferase component of viral defense system
MITQHSFTTDWIDQVSKRYKTDKILVEKSIRALSLLEGLSESSLPFVFKGGTALMLIFKEPHRLSIDIDIILPTDSLELNKTLQQIATSKGFSRIEEQHRISGIVPKAHYKFFYTSAVERKESYILLDILFEQIPYNRIIELPITNIFLATEGEDRTVRVPDANNLLADKLTAFAPRTIGVPYRKGNSECGMEIMKQLYDIGVLYDKADDMMSISAVYRTIAEQEAKYRDEHFSVEDILHDTKDHALSICFRKSQNDVEYQVLERGIKQVSSHIFSQTFHIEEAILSAAKAYYLVSLIETDGITIEKYSGRQLERMRDWLLTDYEYTKLNKIKKSNPEAFFYLYLTLHR